MNPVKERRLKIYSLGWTEIMSLISRIHAGHTHMAYPKVIIPKDAVVTGVFNNQLRGTFDFVVASAEFDPVHEGVEPPRVLGRTEVVQIERAREDTDEMHQVRG